MIAPPRSLFALVAAVLLTPSIVAAQPSGFEMTEVADGVYAAIRSEPLALPVDGNAVVIVNEKGVVVVDANISPSSARAVLAAIRKRTSKPVRFVVNTHWHNDHIFGNQVYAEAFPGVEFIAHPETRVGIEQEVSQSFDVYREQFPKYIAAQEERLQRGTWKDGTAMTEEEKSSLARDIEGLKRLLTEIPSVRLVTPTMTVDRALTLYRGDRIIKILHLGCGNTAGDLVVYLPREKVLITGDLLVSPVPFAFGSYPGEWIQTLQRVKALDADVIIPGHGAVQRDERYLNLVIDLLQSVVDQTRDAVRRGLDLKETREAVDLELFRARFAGEDRKLNRGFTNWFVKPAVKRAFQEARGEFDEE